MKPMKALSIRQPWADCIIFHGKDVENRSWPTRYRGPVLIHAAKAWGPAERETLRTLVSDGMAGDTQTPMLGGIIGRAEIVDCVTAMESPWFYGPYGFVLRNAEPLPFRRCRGALGFFDPGVGLNPDDFPEAEKEGDDAD